MSPIASQHGGLSAFLAPGRTRDLASSWIGAFLASMSQNGLRPMICRAGLFSLLLTAPVSGGIILDFTHGSFFDDSTSIRTMARNALEAAVADINAAIDFNLGAITVDETVGMDGGFQTTHDFDYTYTNPSTGASETITDTGTFAADEVRIFVGMRNLTGTTLGQGGPGGVGLSSGGSSSGGAGSFQGALDDAMANDQHGRGGGPVISTLPGSLGGGSFSFDIGLALGNLWFDSDTDNNGFTDNDATLDANWHFDHTTAVASGKDDFYTVALHEVLHAIGFGVSQSWDDNVSGSNWTGSEAIAANGGSGAGIIDGGHLATGVMSTRLADGTAQAPVMTSTLTTGTRKTLTTLDVAILRDIGFSTVAVPEPSSLLLFGMTLFGIFGRRKRPIPTRQGLSS